MHSRHERVRRGQAREGKHAGEARPGRVGRHAAEVTLAEAIQSRHSGEARQGSRRGESPPGEVGRRCET
jgi:hypothetical protein